MRTNVLLALTLVVGLLAPPGGQQAGAEPLNPFRYLTDEQGRALVLHGLNNGHSSKESVDAMPWTGREDIAAEAHRLGSNAVRLLMFWAKVEPAPGRYDESYLSALAERARWYGEQGMHVILDMHQDTWGPAVAGHSPNNGAPEWATFFDGLPATSRQPWELTYLEPGVIRAFDHFWGTTGKHPELRQRFAAMWRHVAQRFAREPAILAYDLFNEPFGGTSVWPWFERHRLTPFYQEVIAAIREVDQHRWIVVEPQALGGNWGWTSTLGTLDDPRPGESRLVYSPHLYPILVTVGQPYTGATRSLTRAVLEKWRRANQEVARRLDAPLLLGEFGLNATVPGALDYVDDVTAMTDRMGIGWLYWSNDPGGWGPYAPPLGDGRSEHRQQQGAQRSPETSNPTLLGDGRSEHRHAATRRAAKPGDEQSNEGGWAPLADHLARPYPRAIAGEPVRWGFADGTLKIEFRTKSGVAGPTELFLPRGAFPATPTVNCSTPCEVSWDGGRRVAAVHLGEPTTPGIPVTITARGER
ncbi:hypothetical protein GCM10012275_03910 [Longimycelium tulufanense]|uniref:Endoglycoceramidase n=1 Tax=Longimycelium tulufanense TaxID=907463 RepID=A0A8J3C8W3_9PSEU|nr:cellulase family glycosylhydrolase [Longimycelium tulufanense]GGM35857.1 hypothetical protein GCM10012275_03910 [Longimycelium tulufanense]